MKELKNKREQLQNKLMSMEDIHCRKYSQAVVTESAYRDSARAINEVYKELFDICLKLKDPIPKRF